MAWHKGLPYFKMVLRQEQLWTVCTTWCKLSYIAITLLALFDHCRFYALWSQVNGYLQVLRRRSAAL